MIRSYDNSLLLSGKADFMVIHSHILAQRLPDRHLPRGGRAKGQQDDPSVVRHLKQQLPT